MVMDKTQGMPRSIRGLSGKTHREAKIAARKAKKPLGVWLTEAIEEKIKSSK